MLVKCIIQRCKKTESPPTELILHHQYFPQLPVNTSTESIELFNVQTTSKKICLIFIDAILLLIYRRIQALFQHVLHPIENPQARQQNIQPIHFLRRSNRIRRRPQRLQL